MRSYRRSITDETYAVHGNALAGYPVWPVRWYRLPKEASTRYKFAVVYVEARTAPHNFDFQQFILKRLLGREMWL